MARQRQFWQLHSRDWLHEHRHLTLAQISSEIGCSERSAQIARTRFNLRTRPARLSDPDWLKREYDGKTMSAIAAEVGCNPSSVYRALKRYRIPTRRPGTRP